MKTTNKILFCCLNSKKTKDIEFFLLLIQFVCFFFYIIFFSTISWAFIHILYKFLFYLNLVILFISIVINIYFIYIRKKRLINTTLNTLALSLAISIIILSLIVIIINFTSTFNILSQFKKINEQKIVFYKSKTDNILSIISIIFINLAWHLIFFLWIVDIIRIKIKIEDTFYNYLKIKSFKQKFYLFKDELSKESHKNLKINKILKKNKNDLVNTSLKFSTNKKLIEDNNNATNINDYNNSINLSISNQSNPGHSYASSSLSDSFQKPVSMIIIGTDENGFPIYDKQNSFDKSQTSNDSESFSNRDRKYNQNNYIKFNKLPLNIIEDNIQDIENTNLEKNHILEEKDNEDNDGNKPKIVKKINPTTDNENENENNDYKSHFIPLQNGENDKEIGNNNTYEQKTKINE